MYKQTKLTQVKKKHAQNNQNDIILYIQLEVKKKKKRRIPEHKVNLTNMSTL